MVGREGAAAVATSVAAAVLLAAAAALLWHRKQKELQLWKSGEQQKLSEVGKTKDGLGNVRDGILGAIGNTPLIRIRSLSEATGCEIFGKAEFLNPGGSVKDRVAAKIIDEALQSGALRVGGVVTEGSAGSTAVSLAMVAMAHGCRCHVVLPDDAAIEKTQILESMGATVERVRPVSITHKDHFVNVARRRALEAQAALKCCPVPHPITLEMDGQSDPGPADNGEEMVASTCNDQLPQTDSILEPCTSNGDSLEAHSSSLPKVPVRGDLENDEDCSSSGQGGFFADQFENLANFRAHYEGTAPELWKQTGGKLDAFIAAAGTGGTIAGISQYLKEQNPKVKCYLIDPPGSGLYNRVTRGVMYSREEAEGKRMRNPFDTITEGIGINRITENFKQARLDGAFRGTDKEAVEMARFLMISDGLFIGSSSAMNCVGAVRVAHLLGPGHVICTILCDGGARHLSKFHNPGYLAAQGLTPSATSLEFLEHNNGSFKSE